MKILIAGDFCPKYYLKKITNQKIDDYIPSEYLSLIQNYVDYSIVNFESPVVYDNAVAIQKKGPHLRCSKDAMQVVKQIGFNCVTLANNHINDYGEIGIKNTVESCSEFGIDHVGVGDTIKEAKRILYKQFSDCKLAIINCCEHEFSIATKNKPGANPINEISLYQDILDAKSNADYVLVIVHGGHEMFQLPSLRMKELYHFFIDIGADAVVNHHQHCYSGYECYQSKPIFYGIGNFFDAPSSSKVEDLWYYGYLVVLEFGENVKYEIYPYEQCKEQPVIKSLPKASIENKINELNGIINDDEALCNKLHCYYDSAFMECADVANPINNRFLLALQSRGLFPSVITKKWKVKLYDYVQCESLREKFVHFLNK